MKTTISTWKEGPLHFHLFSEIDNSPDLSYLKQDYSDCSKADRLEYQSRDAKRLAAYERGRWEMLTIGVEISIDTATHWAVPSIVGRAYLGGVESDSSKRYITGELRAALTGEALEDMGALFAALRKVLFSLRCEK